MKKTFLVLAAACAAAAGLAAAQQAAPGAQAQGWRARASGWAAAQLNLTEAQKSQSKAIYQDAWKNAKPLVEQMRENRKALAEAVKANDMGKVRQLADKQGDLTGQLTALRAGARAQFYQLLTPEQRAKLDMMMELAGSRAAQRTQRRQQWRRMGAQ